MTDDDMLVEEALRIRRRYYEEGKFVEGSWECYKFASVPAQASDIQLKETKKAFYWGAYQMFLVMMREKDRIPERWLNMDDRFKAIMEELRKIDDLAQ